MAENVLGLPERIFVADLSGEGDFTWVASEAEKPARDDLTWVEYRRVNESEERDC